MRDPTKYFILLSFLIFFLSHQTFPQTHIPTGNVNGKWTKQNSPYYIDGEIKIPYGKKLIIEPGVKVIFTGRYKFEIYGTLIAIGSPQDSIIFTAGNLQEKWKGLRFNETFTKSIFQYCIIEHGWAAANKDKSETYTGKHPYIFEDYSFSSGGGFFIYYSDVDIKNVTIRFCYADFCGGGILSAQSRGIIKDCYIYDNSSKSGAGGIDIWYAKDVQVIDCLIQDNTGTEGGGLRAVQSNNAEIKNCVITNNMAISGGGINFTESNPIISKCIIKENQADQGGGIFIEVSGTILEDIKILDNRAKNNGGGLHLISGGVLFSNVNIQHNFAEKYGGGIFSHADAMGIKFDSLKLSNIYSNSALLGGDDIFSSYFNNIKIKLFVDTFTVLHPSDISINPLSDFDLIINNCKVKQVKTALYVSPEGNDYNSGLSPDEPLKTIKFAVLKILPDSLTPMKIYLQEGIYSQSTNGEKFPINIKENVSLVSDTRAGITWGADIISVSIPWWSSNIALMFYVIFTLALIYLAWQIQLRRIRHRQLLEREKFEAHKLQEVDELKSRFFANISHEFRTPLTLILGPSKQLVAKVKDENIRYELGLIHKNAKKLLELVNQLLDISKLESGSMKLHTSPQNIIDTLKSLILSFSSYAERKRITLKLNAVEDTIVAYADNEKFEEIITNILSNAFKFTAVGGKIEVTVSKNQKYVNIAINDTGIGISKEKLPKIFDRFYQVDGSHTREHEGTGIGLSLTKELVELHKGKIEVESEEGKGTTFIVSIPLGKEHLTPEQIVEKEKVRDYEQGKIEPVTDDEIEKKALHFVDSDFYENQSLPLLLIVEDNPDVRNYIKINLNNEYRVMEAIDGEDGWDKTMIELPDLIVSDIMMPKMDGFKLCEKLKTDERTSHIPVILLTAKAAKEDKLEGYKTGADEYIMKPFEPDELKARIKNLIEQRKRLHQHFQREGIFGLDQASITPLDKKFLQQACEIISQNISSESFGVEVFAEHLSVSKSLLHKKIVALTGEPPVELIRRIRLNKAASLIAEKSGNLSEVALEVGFSNPAYFSECFKKQFGIPPSKYQSSK